MKRKKKPGPTPPVARDVALRIVKRAEEAAGALVDGSEDAIVRLMAQVVVAARAVLATKADAEETAFAIAERLPAPLAEDGLAVVTVSDLVEAFVAHGQAALEDASGKS